MHSGIPMETMFPAGSVVTFNDNCMFWDKTIMYVERYDGPNCPVGAFGIMLDVHDKNSVITAEENFTPTCMEFMRFVTPDEILLLYSVWSEHWCIEKIQRVIEATITIHFLKPNKNI